MTVTFYTLGCKVNQYESENMKSELLKGGITPADSGDIFVINSCTVTAESDRKTRQLVHKVRREHKNAVIVLTGCMPQAFLEEAKKLPCDIILGNTEERDILTAVNDFLKTKKRIVRVLHHTKDEAFAKSNISNFSDRTRAFLKIEDGCNRGCTYCIIPKAKGRVRSRALSDIKHEAQRLSDAGFKEIVLTGINLSSYQHNLAAAVTAAASPENIKRVRLSSLEPDLCSDELLSALKKIPEFCPSFHLALQSGCNKTLNRMNRLYTTEDYYNLVQKIRKLFENAAFTTDIMVGFPGESEEDFVNSMRFCESIGFTHMHIFPYSKRSGTYAYNYKNQVTNAEKQRRARLMKKSMEESAKTVNSKMIGKVCKVLVESDGNGFSENYTKVILNEKLPESSIISAKITDAGSYHVIGEIIKD